MHRLYNPNSGEHFYTADAVECAVLADAGWTYEGVGWVAPAEGDDVYRLYNPYAGDHHYTTSEDELDMLTDVGWSYEGVGWKSGGDVPLYREYNPYAETGSHNYTTDEVEHRNLVGGTWRDEDGGVHSNMGFGWQDEDIAWYGIAEGIADDKTGEPSAQGAPERTWVEEQGHWEQVVVTEAWDEPVYETRWFYGCGTCGFETDDNDIMQRHMEAHAERGEHTGEGTYPKQVQTDTIHHDAVYDEQWVVDVAGHWE